MMGETLSVTSQKTGLFSYCTCTQDRRSELRDGAGKKQKHSLSPSLFVYAVCIYIYIANLYMD